MNIHFNVFFSGGEWIVQGISDFGGKRIYSDSYRKIGTRHVRQNEWVEKQKEKIRKEFENEK